MISSCYCRSHLLLFLVFALAATGKMSAQEPAAPSAEKRIRNLTIVADGPLARIAPEAVRKLITLREGEIFSLSKSKQTIQRLHGTNLFYDIQVEAEPAGDRQVDVILRLIRKFTLKRIRFREDVQLSERVLRRELAFREGEAYSDAALEQTLSRLQALYQDSGFYNARIEPAFELDQETAFLQLDFLIQAGDQARVRELTVDFEGDVESQEILSLIRTRTGEKFAQTQLDEDLQALEAHFAGRGYFRPDIYVRDGVQHDPQTNTVSLTLRVVPREHTELRIEGIPLSEKEISRLPLIRQTGPRLLFLEETLKQLRIELQEDGYYLAKVEADAERQRINPAAIVITVDRGRKYRVAEIHFEGNRFVEDEILVPFLGIRKSGFLSRGRLTEDLLAGDLDRIRSYYQHRGFLDVQATYRLQPQGDSGDLDVLFTIDEGARYFIEQLEIAGNQEITTEELMERVRSREGEPFSPLALAEDRADINALYEDRGYRKVVLSSEVSYPQPGQVRLFWTIEEGPQLLVEDVVVTGNLETRSSVIRRNLAIEPGDPVSLEKILQTETNLYNLTVFNRVQINEVPSHLDPQQRTLIVHLEEARKYTLLYGIGYDSFEGPRGTFGITNNNFLGMARALSFGLRAGRKRQRGNIFYTIPRPFERDIPTLLSLTVHNEKRIRTEERDGDDNILNDPGKPFDQFSVAFSSQSEFRQSRRESLFFRYNFEKLQITVPPELEIPLQFFREEERLRLSKVSLTYVNESRDNPLNPSGGFFLNGEALVSSKLIGSQKQFFRILNQGQYYRRLLPNLVLATSLRLGIIAPFTRQEPDAQTSQIPISERFFSGGATTLRGLPQDLAGPLLRDPETGELILVRVGRGRLRPVPLGGNALLIGNVELRFPILWIISGALFYDVGNVFREVRDIFSREYSNAVGIGFGLDTPVGPVRFDLGYNLNPPDAIGFKHWNFHFNLGQPF